MKKNGKIRSNFVKESLLDYNNLANTLKENTESAVRDLLKETVLEQYAKILVYGRYILRDCIGDEEGYRILRSRISAIHQQVENQLKDMKEEKNSLDRETISLTESFLKYLRRLDREMQKKSRINRLRDYYSILKQSSASPEAARC